MIDTSYFQIFTDCQFVFGFKNTTICDLKKQRFYSFSTEYAREIYSWGGKAKANIIADTKLNEAEQREIFEFLTSHEIVFSDLVRPYLFIDLDLTYASPNLLSNVIIDFSGLENLHKSLSALTHFNSLHLQVRIFKPIEFEELKPVIEICKNSQLFSAELIVSTRQVNQYEQDELLNLIDNNGVVRSLFLLKQANDQVVRKPNFKGFGGVYCLQQEVTDKHDCGIISPHYFNSNITLFTESQHHNTCLNQKLSIDVDGNIKNCPSIPESYGNINDVAAEELIEIVKSSAFQKYWNIKKDDIKICRDCEFRHICTDCRAYREDDADMYSKPLKCGYNPYIAKWNTEEGYQTVAESIADGVVSEEFVYRPLD